MSRFSGNKKAYDFHVRRLAWDHYRLGWIVDFHYPDSRLRFPRQFSRNTDEAGMKRFCKKHGIAEPQPKKEIAE